MKFTRLQPRDDRGAAAVELALVVPLLLLILIGILNLGYMMAQQVEVNSAARHGGRAAVVSNGTGTAHQKATAAVTNTFGHMVPLSEATNTATSGTTCGTGTSIGEEMRVTARYTNPSWLLTVPFIPAPAELTATAAFRCEW